MLHGGNGGCAATKCDLSVVGRVHDAPHLFPVLEWAEHHQLPGQVAEGLAGHLDRLMKCMPVSLPPGTMMMGTTWLPTLAGDNLTGV